MKQKRINKKKLELARYVVLLIIMNAYQTARKQISWIARIHSRRREGVYYLISISRSHRKKKIIRCHPATPS